MGGGESCDHANYLPQLSIVYILTQILCQLPWQLLSQEAKTWFYTWTNSTDHPDQSEQRGKIYAPFNCSSTQNFKFQNKLFCLYLA